jgi:hypothetical protein
MSPSSLNQTALHHQVKVFIKNAVEPDLSAILAATGCDQPFLTLGSTLQHDWEIAQARAGVLDGQQQATTESQTQARKAARSEMADLGNMIRGEFAGNTLLLTKLGLKTKSKAGSGRSSTTAEPSTSATSQTDADESDADADDNVAEAGTSRKSRSAPKGRYSLATEIAHWRRLLINLATLTEAERERLTRVGWGAERIAAVDALVHAVADADTNQQAAIQVKQAAFAEAGLLEKQLRRWYSRAVRLARSAIKRHDPTNQDRWLKRLGL